MPTTYFRASPVHRASQSIDRMIDEATCISQRSPDARIAAAPPFHIRYMMVLL
jgi:hypothetical protein